MGHKARNPGLSFPVVQTQYFWEIRLNELLDWRSYQVEKFIKDCETPRDAADKIIRYLKYPFYAGRPCDRHEYNAFRGKYCRTVDLDYWARASECLASGWGDCEDGSIALVAALRRMGLAPEDVYVVFGYVRNAETGEVLGGHGWVYARHPSFGKDGYIYIETTLDEPPKEYPEVPDITKPFRWKRIELVPEFLWNDEVYKPVAVALGFIIYWFHRYWGVKEKILGYLDLKKRLKETRRKYEGLQRAWQMPVKPLKKAGILSRLRWRR